MIDTFSQAHAFDQVSSTLNRTVVGTAVGQCRNQDVFQHRELGQQVMVLEDEANIAIAKLCQLRFVQFKRILPAQRHRSRRRFRIQWVPERRRSAPLL